MGRAVGPERARPRLARLAAAAASGAAAADLAAAAAASAASAAARSAAAERRARGDAALSDADRDKVAAAIAAAEAKSSGEIVAVATPISDSYHDVALHWALVPLFAVLAWAAWRPTALAWWYDLLFGGWQPDPTLSELLTLLMVFAALKFTVALLILKWMPLRLALTPAATKHRRVRRRAIAIFKAAAAERRTAGSTGILIYLSMAERRAEIVADEAILKVTDDHTWGEAMAALIGEVRQGTVGDGICAAIERVGVVLAEHFPRSADDMQRDSGQADRAMNLDDLPPPEVMWAGKFVRAIKRGKWEYASRTNNISAVVDPRRT